MHTSFIALLLMCALSIATQTKAASRNDIPSCYAATDTTGNKPNKPNRELFVAVDSTTELDTTLMRNVHEQIQHFVQPGDKVTLIAFAANHDLYSQVQFTGEFESLPSKSLQDSMNALKLKSLKRCLKAQPNALNAVHHALKATFEHSDSTRPNSEILSSLHDIALNLIATSEAEVKVLLLASDMLQNSDDLSFFRSNNIQRLNSQALLKQADPQPSTLLSNTKVHVIGSGFQSDIKLSPSTLKEIELFWTAIIENMDGTVVQFGKPNLLNSIAG
ncbi:hypothetical protein ACP3V3_17015 [Vibrio sp. PNB22_3_1]